jgi:hypothetical protein
VGGGLRSPGGDHDDEHPDVIDLGLGSARLE